jgi:hypothetical protein
LVLPKNDAAEIPCVVFFPLALADFVSHPNRGNGTRRAEFFLLFSDLSESPYPVSLASVVFV